MIKLLHMTSNFVMWCKIDCHVEQFWSTWQAAFWCGAKLLHMIFLLHRQCLRRLRQLWCMCVLYAMFSCKRKFLLRRYFPMQESRFSADVHFATSWEIWLGLGQVWAPLDQHDSTGHLATLLLNTVVSIQHSGIHKELLTRMNAGWMVILFCKTRDMLSLWKDDVLNNWVIFTVTYVLRVGHCLISYVFGQVISTCLLIMMGASGRIKDEQTKKKQVFFKSLNSVSQIQFKRWLSGKEKPHCDGALLSCDGRQHGDH